MTLLWMLGGFAVGLGLAWLVDLTFGYKDDKLEK